MHIDDNWLVPVLHNGPQPRVLVDPVLKIALRMFKDRQEPEEENWSMQIDYDPQIAAERLAVPMTPEEIDEGFFGIVRKVPEQPMKYFESNDLQRRVYGHAMFNIIDGQSIENNNQMIIPLCGKSIGVNCIIAKRKAVPAISDYPYHVLLHCLKNYIRFQHWEQVVSECNRYKGTTYNRVTLLVPQTVADEFARETGEVLPPFGDSNYALVATREIAA